MPEEFARKARINLKKPFEELPAKARDLLTGGGGFAGILGILQELYQDSSEAYREWLTDYMSPWSAPPARASGCGRPAWRCA